MENKKELNRAFLFISIYVVAMSATDYLGSKLGLGKLFSALFSISYKLTAGKAHAPWPWDERR